MLCKLFCLSLLVCLESKFCLSQDVLPQLETPLVRLRGYWKTTIHGRKYAAFEGIPFAKPPVGDLRFEAPVPISAWLGTWEANNLHTCLQVDMFSPDTIKKIIGQEDCLYLNVYVPAEFLNKPNNLDVIVSIHGGAFTVGSGHTGASSNLMMDRDIILVTINYRMSVLGFLSTEDDVIPGNNGMKDQTLALKWVKDNIRSFGGNPDSVTIVGVSAGAGSVHLHYLSPLSKGLFARGISQSGTALAPWAIKRNALKRAKRFASLVGCPESPSKDLKACLKQRPAENLLKQLEHLFEFASSLPVPFAPVVEKASSNAYLDKEPFQLLKEGKVFDVPWITSFTADDGFVPAGFFSSNLDLVNENWSNVSKYVLDYVDTVPASKEAEIAEQILKFYLGSGERINKENFKKFTQMCTDRIFGTPAEIAAKMQAKVTKSPVYFYIFNYREGQFSLAQIYAPGVEGVAHGDDAIYFYGYIFEQLVSDQDTKLRDACQDMLYSFASGGKPSFDGSDSWEPTTSDELVYLNVTGPDNFILQRTENLTPSDFWNKVGLLENENLITKDEL